MRSAPLVLVLCLIPAFIIPAPQEELVDPTRIVVFTPTTRGNAYRPEVYEILEAAAEDLDIEILGYQFDVGDRFAKHTEGLRILRETPGIDGAIFSVAFGQAQPLLEEAETQGFPVMIQGPLLPSEWDKLRRGPRRSYEQWIGYFYQNEEEKGYRLARELLERARAHQ